MHMEYISTEQAAKELGVTMRRVQAMIQAGRLKAEKLGGVWLIHPRDLDAVRDRKPGRPPQGHKR